MNPFNQLINKYNNRYNKKIINYCRPILENFGVSHFWYHRISDDGSYTCLGSNLPWIDYYFSESLYLPNPFLRDPRTQEAGVRFVQKLGDYSYLKSKNIGDSSFAINQSLILLEKFDGYVEGYGFASHIDKEHFETLCLNELGILKCFAKHFRQEFSPVISDMSEEPVNMATLIGQDFFADSCETKIPSIDRGSILEQFQLSEVLSLTHRESQVLLLVSKGLFAIQIAEYLQLSKRTVEHYIENVKNKLNCYSKAELIQKAQKYISLGYSLP